MSRKVPQSNQEPFFLGHIASIIGLLGVAFYFVGWIYRWTYFGFFQLSISTLDFSFESFFFIPLQVFFANHWAFFRFILVMAAVAVSIRASIWGIKKLRSHKFCQVQNLQSRFVTYLTKLRILWVIRELRLLIKVFPNAFINELIIVIWIFIALFWLARWQGELDARRDAVVTSSGLPIITFVTPHQNKIPLGRKLEDLLTDPSLSGYRIIGDKDAFDSLFGRETNYATESENAIVWRLLIKHQNWIYIFPCLPPNAGNKDRPYLLAISESQSGDQLLILGGSRE